MESVKHSFSLRVLGDCQVSYLVGGGMGDPGLKPGAIDVRPVPGLGESG